jgi:DNA repair photolyase
MEPRTATYKQRFRAIEELSAKGIPVNVMAAPIIPGLNDHEIPAILKKAAECGAVSAAYTFVRLNGQIGDIFENWVRLHFPDRANKVLSQISSGHEGKLNDTRWGKRMTGDGIMAETVRKVFKLYYKKYFEGREMPSYNTSAFIRPQKGQLSLF